MMRMLTFSLCSVLLPGTLLAQSAAFRKCDDPKIPIGRMATGTATAAFRLTKDGRPDTSTVLVAQHTGLSTATAHSVATRVLAACHFDVPKGVDAASSNWSAEFKFDSLNVAAANFSSRTETLTPIALEAFDLSKDSFPLSIDDHRLEEQPRPLSCSGMSGVPSRTISVSGRGTSQAAAKADAQAQMAVAQHTENANWNSMNAGELVALIQVLPNGRPGTAVRPISSTNPSATTSLANLIGGCTFVPGRYHGVIVPAMYRMRVKVDERQ